MKSFKDAQVMKKDKKETLLFQMRADREAWDNLQLLRVILHEEYTKVDFGYAASGYYIKGGWVRIHDCISIDSKTDLILGSEMYSAIAPKRFSAA